MKKVFTDIIPHLAFLAGTSAYVAANQSDLTYKLIYKDYQHLHLKQKSPYSLNIQGNNNTIHIASGSDLIQLRISGSGNHLVIENEVNIKHHLIRGSNNTIEVYMHNTLCLEEMNSGNLLLKRLS